MSSFLKWLPLVRIKIDQSFIRDMGTHPSDPAIIRAIVTLAQSLGISVIAEGVETTDQRDALRDIGCSMYQGYLYGRPLPVDEFENLALGFDT